MREILFRGQTRRKGEKVRMDGTPVESNWVYGGVLQGTGDFSVIYQTKPSIEKKPVYTNTLGQYTGLIDKNGTKIFEGDIVRYNDTIHKVIFCTINGCAFFGITMPDRGEIWNFDGITCANKMEVIGNIYDNPELIGGMNNG